MKLPLKIIPFENLAQTDFFITDIFVDEMFLMQEGFETKGGRGLNGFMYVLKGECVYQFMGHRIPLRAGNLIYLPKGSHHKCVVGRRFDYIRIDFKIIDAAYRSEIIFSESPMLINIQNPQLIKALAQEMIGGRISPSGKEKLKLASQLYNFLYTICVDSADPKMLKLQKRIAAGVDYVERSYNTDFDLNIASELCNLSTSRFRAIFRQVTGMSVMEYRENMKMERACVLLL